MDDLQEVIRIEYENGFYYGYYYDKELTKQSTLLKAIDRVQRYIKSQKDKQ